MYLLKNKTIKVILTAILLGIQISLQYYRDTFLLVFDERILMQGALNCINICIYFLLLCIWLQNKKAIYFFIIVGILICTLPFIASYINKQTDFLFIRMRYYFIDQPMLLILLIVFDNQSIFSRE